MKKIKILGLIGWALFFILLFFRGCENSETQIVKVPEISNVFKTDTIIKHEIVEVEKIIKDRKNENKLSKDILEMHERLANYQEEFEHLHDVYKFADSTQKDSLYKLATKIKAFNSNYEDEFLKLKINGIIANNEVKEITPSYTIKAVKKEQVRFRLLAGGGINSNFIGFGNLGFQNKKGNILFFGYDSQRNYSIAYSFSILKF